MARKMTAEEVKAWKARWERVNEFEKEELRKTSLEHRFAQLAAMMSSVDQLGWRHSLKKEEEEGRKRWLKLRKAYGL